MARLMVLGLLKRKPMHGYEMQQALQQSKADQWTDILPGSIYYALKQMQKEGLVQVRAHESTGHRTKAVYEITEAGVKEFHSLLKEAWSLSRLSLPTTLYTALSFVDELPLENVLEAIANQISALEIKLADWDTGESIKTEQSNMPGFVKSLFNNGKQHIHTDLELLRHLQEQLPLWLQSAQSRHQ